MYIFGHSAGAIHGIDLGVMESEYFAAVAVHAGVLSPEVQPIMEQAPRKIPLAIWIGTKDEAFPLDAVRRSRDLLKSNGFDVQFTEIPNHTHDYYSTAAKTNKGAWAFLSQHALTADPKFQEYQTPSRGSRPVRQGRRLDAPSAGPDGRRTATSDR
jgi:dienelactone hydrolase